MVDFAVHFTFHAIKISFQTILPGKYCPLSPISDSFAVDC